jgi:hypothetical protein
MNSAEHGPPTLYRVQHNRSFTYYADEHGFQAREGRSEDMCYYFDPQRIYKHLDWNDRSMEPTPFISLFDNLGKTIST